MSSLKTNLLTLLTKSPLHVGCGTSVDVVDLPIMRERITAFPVIPATSLKGVLLQRAREHFENGSKAREKALPEEAKTLFGEQDNAGCVQIMEAKLLAFPVRSLAGCFAWVTCPLALARYQRDTGRKFPVPSVEKDQVVCGKDCESALGGEVVLEEYALKKGNGDLEAVIAELRKLSDDPLWTQFVAGRLIMVHDENFQHLVQTCTEVVARIVIDPSSRTNENLFNQENVPCETLFYSVLTTLPPRRPNSTWDQARQLLCELIAATPTLQIGGDETTGHGLCSVKEVK